MRPIVSTAAAEPPQPLRGASLVLRYSAFAVLATLANLAAQRLVLAAEGWRLWDSLHLPHALWFMAALVTGTAVGLVVKYALDKRWIFQDRSTGAAAHGKRFSLYALMGLATTALFWGSETAFWLAFGTTAAREWGAVLGLAVGYAVKYQLDYRFVFTPAGTGAE